jgi:hypothetical protein
MLARWRQSFDAPLSVEDEAAEFTCDYGSTPAGDSIDSTLVAVDLARRPQHHAEDACAAAALVYGHDLAEMVYHDPAGLFGAYVRAVREHRHVHLRITPTPSAWLRAYADWLSNACAIDGAG